MENDHLAGIVADLISDGHLEIRNIGARKKYDYIGFFSSDEGRLKNFNERIFKISGIRGSIREWGIRKYGKSKACIISNSKLVKALNEKGAPYGDKVSKPFKLPDWIKYGNEEIQSSFIKRLVDCDGSIGYDKNTKRWEIRLTLHKLSEFENDGREFLENIRYMLKNFDIESTEVFVNRKYIRPKDNKLVLSLTFKIFKKNSILNYNKFIGFDSEYKKVRIKNAIKWAIGGSG
jgi:intein/homing endonuclease